MLFLGIVHLHLETLRGPAGGLRGRVEIEARVGAGERHDLGGQFEVFERGRAVGARVKEVGARAVADDGTVFDAEGGRVFGGLPAGERASVEE